MELCRSRQVLLLMCLLGLPLSAVAAQRAGVADRPGGLLPCEAVPGEAVTRRRPDPIVVPRADGGASAVFFHSHAVHSKLPLQVVFLDLRSGASHVQDLPGMGNPWSQVRGPDGKQYFGLWGPAAVYRYNPATDRIEQLGIIEPSERNVPHLTVGTDNKVYGLTSSQGHVFSIDPATDEIVHYGRQGEKRTFLAYSGSIGVDDEFIYTTLGNIPAETRTLAMNKRSREVTVLAEITGAGMRQGPLGVTASHQGKEYWLYQGKAIAKKSKDESPPWPDRPLPARKTVALQGKPEVSPAYDTTGDGSYNVWFRNDAKAAWQSATYKVTSEPVALSRCATLPDGRVMASTIGYEGIYTLDPKTDRFVWEGWTPTSHYSTLIRGGLVYLASYPGGHGLFVWDPARPWTVGKDTPERPAPDMNKPESNPRRLEPWAREGNFQFPKRFVEGAEGTMFVGIHGERANVGSTLSWRNLDTKETGFLREPFELYDVCGMCTALGGTKIAYATFSVKGIKGEPRPESGRLFVIDVATRKVDWFIEPFAGMRRCGMMAEGKPGQLLLATDWRADGQAGSTLYQVDMKTRSVAQKVELPGVMGSTRGYFEHIDFRKGPDGMVYTLYDDLLVRIDPQSLAVTALSKVGATGHVAFVGRDVYLTGLSHFRRIRNVVDAKAE